MINLRQIVDYIYIYKVILSVQHSFQIEPTRVYTRFISTAISCSSDIYILCVFLTLFFIFGTPFESALLDLSVSYNGKFSTRETLEMDAPGEKVCIYNAASAVC